MPAGLEVNLLTLTPLAIAIAALATTLIRFGAAIQDRRALEYAINNGLSDDKPVTRRLVRSSVRRESLRIGKHLLTIFAIASSLSPLAVWSHYMDMRNWYAAGVAILLASNSVADHLLQRYAMNYYRLHRIQPENE